MQSRVPCFATDFPDDTHVSTLFLSLARLGFPFIPAPTQRNGINELAVLFTVCGKVGEKRDTNETRLHTHTIITRTHSHQKKKT